MELIYTCPKCGENEKLQCTYDYTKQHRPIKEVFCTECSTTFEGDMFVAELPKNAPTPKDKAEELLAFFMGQHTTKLSDYSYVYSPTAKLFANKVADEVLGHMGADRGYEFWTQVKIEIESL